VGVINGGQTDGLWELNGGAFAPSREMGFLIQAAVLAKAQRPPKRNAHYYGAI